VLPASKVAGTGQLSFSLTWEKVLAKGVALSRARAHQMRLTCLSSVDCAPSPGFVLQCWCGENACHAIIIQVYP